jgi:Holliday junction resolvase
MAKINSRRKGMTFENELCKILRDELGDCVDAGTIKRNLTQYQQVDCTDIIVGNVMAIEAKRYAQGNWYKPEWWSQAQRSAALLNMIPVLIWKFDRQPIRVTAPLYFIGHELALDNAEHDFPREGNACLPVTVELPTGLMLMREWLA